MLSSAAPGVCTGPGAYTPRTPESSHKKHRTPEVNNPNAAAAIAALQAKLKAARRAATSEAHLVDEVIRATLKFGSVQVTRLLLLGRVGSPDSCLVPKLTVHWVHKVIRALLQIGNVQTTWVCLVASPFVYVCCNLAEGPSG